MTPNTKRKLIHYWRRHVRPILVLVLVFTAFRSSMFDWNDVPSGSMEPTIFIGDRIFVNKLSYGLKVPYTTWHVAKWSGPQRGEIVVFYGPAPDHTRLVKRVIGLPGDRIEMTNGFLKITDSDGKVVPIRYEDATPPVGDIPATMHRKAFRYYTEHIGDRSHTMALFDGRPSVRDGVFDVKQGEYFMMGDNRDNSNDSRFIGAVPREQILGRANRVVFSLDYDDSYLPRKDRFFHALP
jgi:signal peptidase I